MRLAADSTGVVYVKLLLPIQDMNGSSAMLLQAYLCKLGFARFCNIKYTAANSAEADISNPYVHLTNVSIQRRGEEYNESHGNKWPLSCLLAWLQVGTCSPCHCSHAAFSMQGSAAAAPKDGSNLWALWPFGIVCAMEQKAGLGAS